MSLNELRVRSPLDSNRNPSLTSNRSSVVYRDTPCASPGCLQAAQVVETKRGLLERDCAMAAAAAVAEKLILSHVCGRQRDRHRALRGHLPLRGVALATAPQRLCAEEGLVRQETDP